MRIKVNVDSNGVVSMRELTKQAKEKSGITWWMAENNGWDFVSFQFMPPQPGQNVFSSPQVTAKEITIVDDNRAGLAKDYEYQITVQPTLAPRASGKAVIRNEPY
jgi:hypothetical protein